MKRLFNALKSNIKSYLLAGLATVIPIAITLWVLKSVVLWSDALVKNFIPEKLHPENLLGYTIPGLGIVVTILSLILIGLMMRLYIGKKLLKSWEKLVARIPFGRGIYQALRDFAKLTFSEDGKSFQQVALVEYPRKGLWVMAFVTGEASGEIQEKTSEKTINVFIPTTPNPTSGFLLMVPEQDLIILEMKVEIAMKVIISAGVVKGDETGTSSP